MKSVELFAGAGGLAMGMARAGFEHAAVEVYFGRTGIEYGCQEARIGATVLLVLPSTSGAARGYWDPRYWRELARLVSK